MTGKPLTLVKVIERTNSQKIKNPEEILLHNNRDKNLRSDGYSRVILYYQHKKQYLFSFLAASPEKQTFLAHLFHTVQNRRNPRK